MNKEKIREKRIFEIVHCPFEGRAKLHHLWQPNGPVGRCQLGGNLKGQYTISKIVFFLLLCTFTEQNTFFSETCFAFDISEKKFRECKGNKGANRADTTHKLYILRGHFQRNTLRVILGSKIPFFSLGSKAFLHNCRR